MEQAHMGFTLQAAALAVTAGWLALVALLRQREKQARHRAAASSAKDLYMHIYIQFPFLFRKGAELGLYRVLGIPSISRLLVATRQFEKDPDGRYDSTDTLISEAMIHPQTSERFQLACARMNQIHGMYSSSISRGDMKYTLSALIVQPVELMNAYAARRLSPEEVQAIVDVSNTTGQGLGLTDLPETYAGWKAFQEEYDAQHLVYHPNNQTVQEYQTRLLLSIVPSVFHGLARLALSALLDEPMREALGLPKAPWAVQAGLQLLLAARAAFIWLFVPPGTKWQGRIPLGQCPAAGDKLFLNWHVFQPTLKDGYEIETLGPSKCPVLSRAQLLQQWGQGGRYAEDLRRSTRSPTKTT